MSRTEKRLWIRYLLPLLLIAGWTGFARLVFPRIELVNLVMTYLLANVLIAVRFGQGPSLVSAVLSVALFDFFFVPPHLTFAVADAKYLVTFLIMFVVTLLTSRLTIQLRRKAEEVHRAQIEAERETMMSSLLSSFSHDLRTPLTSLVGAASTLVQDHELSGENRKRLCETIYEESNRLSRLVGNVLQMTKVEAGHLHPKKDRNSLEEVIGSALNRLEPVLKGRSVAVEIPENLPLVPMDDVLIEQVIVNILENAVRYTPAGSPIEIRTVLERQREKQRDRQAVTVEILDRGTGIPPADRDRIFEKFYRGKSKEIPGSGLGLAICRGILQAHGGAIGVRPREGGGSVLYFSLPLQGERKGI